MGLEHLREHLRSWLQERIGAPRERYGADPVPVIGLESRAGAPPALHAALIDDSAIVTVRPDWEAPLHKALRDLSVEELFSIYGAYEISRVTMEHGVSVFGPYWCYAADDDTFRPTNNAQVVMLEAEEIWEAVDPNVFWHCFAADAIRGFAIYEGSRVAALASVREESAQLLEIGVDAAPDHKWRGLGQAVVSAAGSWILGQGRLIWYTTSPWNVPSARTARSVGLRHVWSEMVGLDGPFRMPPSPLGKPRSDARLQHYYPAWAMNPNIEPRPEA